MKKGFIQIPLLIAIVVSVVMATGVGYGTVEYKKISGLVEKSNQLAKEEKYSEANEELEFAQNSWFVKTFGIQKEKIVLEIENNKKLLEDKLEYAQGIEEFNKENWDKASDLLLKVSSISLYYRNAQEKFVVAQNKIKENCFIEAIFDNETKEIIYYFPGCGGECYPSLFGIYLCPPIEKFNYLKPIRYVCTEEEAKSKGWKRYEGCPEEEFNPNKYKADVEKAKKEDEEIRNTCTSFDYKKCIEKCYSSHIFGCEETCIGMKDACSGLIESELGF
jgi:hypothetical protein